MSEQTIVDGIPRVELKHRLALALEYAGVSNDQMADHLDKSVTTVRNYLTGRTTPDRSTCRDWAMRCGVQLDWLLYGRVETPDDGPGGKDSLSTRWDHDNVVDLRARLVSPPSMAQVAA